MPREFLIEFIQIYKNEPCLWQMSSKDYHDRNKKEAGYAKLVKKLKEVDAKATKDDVIKKINNLRSAVRKESKKIKDSLKSGASLDSMYKPRLWYFSMFNFLADQDKPQISHSNVNIYDDGIDEENSSETNVLNAQECDEEFLSQSATNSNTSEPSTPQMQFHKRDNKQINAEGLAKEALILSNNYSKMPHTEEDRFDVIGKGFAIKLRGLPKQQMILAEKLINDILFLAELDSLTLSHRVNGESQPNHFSRHFSPVFYQDSPASSHISLSHPSPIIMESPHSELPQQMNQDLDPDYVRYVSQGTESFLSSFDGSMADSNNDGQLMNQVVTSENNSLNKTENVIEPDLYSYTKLNDFTSEIYKIELGNLPNYTGYGQLRKLLNSSLKLNPRKVKALGNPLQMAFITFKNEEDRNKALQTLNGYVWRGKPLFAKIANPAADPMAQKRKAGDSEDCAFSKKAKEDDVPLELRLKNAVTPFWNIPYEEQLKKKESEIQKFLVKLVREIEKTNKNVKSSHQNFRKENNYQCCPLEPIKPSPVTSAYRNKCEFTIGKHLLTKEKTVGFRLSAYKEGSMSVAEPDDCINISADMLKAVKSFQNYIRESEKDVYNPENHGGYWRQLTVRTSNNSDILLIVVMHPQSLTEEELELEKTKIKKYYEDGKGSTCGITSIYFQLFSKKASHEESVNMTHLMGKKFLEESLLDMKFQISPEAFFQINVPATEVLYSMIANMITALSTSASILDICCGTGTISLCLAKAGAKVIGIEMCTEAVDNARINAEKNNLETVEFICGKAEDVILTAIDKCGTSEIIAVVDPPRAGLHQKVVKIIRGTEKIQKLIYISCSANTAYQNFVDLCRPTSNNYRGAPFHPIKAAAVDMFPHTPHRELVLVFERMNDK